MNRVSKGLKKSIIFWLTIALVEVEAGQDTGSWMSSKLENALPLFLNVTKSTGSLLTPGLYIILPR